MLEKGHFRARFIVERYHFLEDGKVSGLFQVCYRAEYQPHGIVVEPASDIVVAALAERLVLMIAAAVRELRRRNVDDAFPGTSWYLVHESHEVLV